MNYWFARFAIIVGATLGQALLLCAQQQGVTSASPGEVVGVIQWFNAVPDLEKAEQFWHALMGLEPGAGDPKMRLTWYDVRPFLTEMYITKAKLRNFELRIPGAEMGVEPVQWSESKGKPFSTRLQDPGAAHLILRTRNVDAIVERLSGPGSKLGVKILTAGGKPVKIAGPTGSSRVVWLREPNGFFVELAQPDPLPEPAEGANFAPALNYYTGGDAGFTVENLENTVKFYRDVLGFQVQEMTEFASNKDQLASFGLSSGQCRTAVLRTPESSSVIRLIEFKGMERKPLHTQIIDPGTLVLRMRVRGVVALAEKLKAAGTKIVSLSGQPYANGTDGNVCQNDRGCWFMVQGPDNVFVQLVTATPQNAQR